MIWQPIDHITYSYKKKTKKDTHDLTADRSYNIFLQEKNQEES